MKTIVVVLFTLFVISEAKLPLPSYIKPCHQSDPQLNECFGKSANDTIKAIVKGDESYNIHQIDPLIITKTVEVILPPIKLSLKNLIVFGLENMAIVDSKVDLKNKVLQYTQANPLIVWKAQYTIEGDILGKNQKVEGNVEITFPNGEYLVAIEYELENIDGEDYAKVTKPHFKFLKYDIDFNFTNLDLNPEVRDVWNKVKGGFVTDVILQACAAVNVKYINSIFKVVPFKEVFPE